MSIELGEEAVEVPSSETMPPVVHLASIKDDGFVPIDDSEIRVPNDDLRRFQSMGYQFGTKMGTGSFGEVYRCQFTDKSGNVTDLAAKLILIKEGLNENELIESLTYIKVEMIALSRALHPHVVILQNCVSSAKWNREESAQTYPYNGYTVMFMELADTILEEYLQKVGLVPEDICKEFMAQLVCGIGYLHSIGVAARDIKPHNVLLFRNDRWKGGYRLKHCDFGISHIFEPTDPESYMDTDLLGTEMYQAPETEQTRWAAEDRAYDTRLADVYSLGIMMCQMLVGHRNVRGAQLFYKKKNFWAKLLPQIKRTASLSADCIDLMAKMIEYEAADRPDIKSILAHPFLPPVLLEERWMRDTDSPRSRSRSRSRSTSQTQTQNQ